MFHDEFHGLLVNVKIFLAIGEYGLTDHGPVYGGHFKSREVIHIGMPCREFIGSRPQG